MSRPSPSNIEKLRTAVSAIEGRARDRAAAQPFGVEPLDRRLADGGLRIDALHEFSARDAGWGDDAAAVLFVAGVAARNAGQVLWIARRRDLFAPGLHQAGLAAERLVHAEVGDDAELLDVMEDALRYRGLAAVIGEVKRAGLTQTRRLQLAAEGGTTSALLVRRHIRLGVDPLAEPSAATTRWRIASTPSGPLATEGVGRARWRVQLVRQRGGDPFELMVEACDETGRCALAAELVDRPDRAGGADARAA